MSRWTQLASQLRAGVQALSLRAQKKILVGSDRAGNRYFVQVGAEHKRWVEHPGSENLGDSRTVPLAWYGWLRHTRTEAPTVEEVDAEAAAQAALQQRVAALNAADAKLRLQEMAEKNIGGPCAAMRCDAMHCTLWRPTARAPTELPVASGSLTRSPTSAPHCFFAPLRPHRVAAQHGAGAITARRCIQLGRQEKLDWRTRTAQLSRILSHYSTSPPRDCSRSLPADRRSTLCSAHVNC